MLNLKILPKILSFMPLLIDLVASGINLIGRLSLNKYVKALLMLVIISVCILLGIYVFYPYSVDVGEPLESATRVIDQVKEDIPDVLKNWFK